MFSSGILDVAIGLVTLFIVFAIASSSVTEQISQVLMLRAENLWESICALVGDHTGGGLAAQIYDHQLIQGLAVSQDTKTGQQGLHPADRRMPAQIPGDVFASALVDTLIQNSTLSTGPVQMSQLTEAAFAPHVKPDLAHAVQGFLHESQGDVTVFKQKVADWFDAAMARSTGWYKRKVQAITFGIAFLLVFFANADCLMLANELWSSPTQRAVIVAQAGTLVKAGQPPTSGTLSNQEQLLGWAKCPEGAGCTKEQSDHSIPPLPRRAHFWDDLWSWLIKILGLLATAYAASLGAPFWFKVLQQTMSLRDSVTGKEKSK